MLSRLSGWVGVLAVAVLALCASSISSVAAQDSFVTSAPCTAGDRSGDLNALKLSADTDGNQIISLSPSFSNSVSGYTATYASDVTTMYVTLTQYESMQQIWIRFNENSWTSLDTTTTDTVTISFPVTGNGVADYIYVLVDCNCHKEFSIVCKPADTGVRGDPQFTGLKGQSYQVHGIPNEFYNLISDSYIQYNSKFVFLSSGECPIVNGVEVKGDCWTHPGTYLGEVGLMTTGGDRIHLIAGDRRRGFRSVLFNGEPLQLGESRELHFGSNSPALPYPSYFNFTSTHSITVEGAGFYSLVITNSDLFINQKIDVLNWEKINSHGLLGQTWHQPTRKGQLKEIEGYVDDYLLLDHQLWGSNFIYNQFPVDATTAPATPVPAVQTTPVMRTQRAKAGKMKL